jgi:hypothetical protein
MVMSLVAQLFNLPPPDETILRLMPSLPAVPVQQLETIPAPTWWELTRSWLLWIFLGAVLVVAIIQYLRLHDDVFKAIRRAPGWNVLAWFWKFFGGVKTELEKIVEAARARLQRGRSAGASWGYMNLRRLDPRQRVRFFYLALVRRGAETGLSRSPAQTPREYAATLDRALPEAETDIDALTDEFIKARYTRAAVAPEEARQVKSWWERIKKMLQERK